MDQYHGQGGSYLFDPATGQRVLLERTEEPLSETMPALQPRRRRARTEQGKFQGDNPATPDVNEAWQ